MRSSAILTTALTSISLVSAQVVTGQLGDAIRVVNDPAGAAYQAVVPVGKYGNVQGSITAVAAGEEGTQFEVNFSGLPTTGGPFGFHIHVMPVGADLNCNDTLGHLDPMIRGEAPACTASRPETCQVGDLAGKYGKANGTTYRAAFTDPYVSLKDGVGAFFGNRSFVIHFANTSRLACANFESIVQNGPSGTQPLNSTASATLVPAVNANVSTGTLGSATTSTTTLIASTSSTGAPSSSSSTPKPSQSPAQSNTSAAVRDVASKLLLAGSLAVAMWVL